MTSESKVAIIKLDKGFRNKGTVSSIIICDETGIKGLTLPENTAIWDCTDYLVDIGDRWEDGIFTHPDGTDVAPYESPEQTQINELRKKNAELEQASLDNAEMILDMQTAQLGGNV